MSRHTYSILAIARRHPKMFAAMHKRAENNSDVVDGNDGFHRANDAMRFAMKCDEAIEQLRIIRGEPYTWACVPWRTDAPARRRDEPRASRWGDLA